MKSLLLLVLIIVVAGCAAVSEKSSSTSITKIPENYSAEFSSENYSLENIGLNISNPLLVDKFRWGRMPLKIFPDKTYMRDFDLQDFKKGMD